MSRGRSLPTATISAAILATFLTSAPARARHPVFEAAQRGQVGRLQAILKKNPQVVKLRWGEGRFTPLHLAARYGQVKAAALLLKKGADLEAKTGEGEAWTPLHYAAAEGRVEMVAFLIQKGAKIEAKGMMYGNTPLHVAAQAGHAAVVQLLLARGAKSKVKNNKGLTPADLARTACRARNKASCLAVAELLK